MFRSRPVVEIIELLFAFTICLAILLIGAGIVVLSLVDNQVDPARLSDAADFLKAALSSILGAVLGLLAGRAIKPSEEQR
jgi:ABC-type Fe3+ transport system permease subunit